MEQPQLTPEQMRDKLRDIISAVSETYPNETDFTYRHEQVPYTLTTVRDTARVCFRHLVNVQVETAAGLFNSMHQDAEELRKSDPGEYTESIERARVFLASHQSRRG